MRALGGALKPWDRVRIGSDTTKPTVTNVQQARFVVVAWVALWIPATNSPHLGRISFAEAGGVGRQMRRRLDLVVTRCSG